ncbi:MAG: site-specific DNA-methyltransferase [Chloroflexota bacterium]
MLEPFFQDPYCTVYHADCLAVLPKLGVKADLIICDPPWGVSGEQDVVIHLKEGDKVTGWQWDRFKGNEFWGFTFKWADATIPLLKDGGHLIVWFDAWKISPLAAYLEEKGLRRCQALQWVKTNATPQMRAVGFMSSVESAFWFTKGDKSGTFNHKLGERPNYWRLSPGSDGARFHPTQKPTEMIMTLISYLTKEGDLVVDPMFGGGSTLVAAKRLGRYSLGIEKELGYCQVARYRLLATPLPMLVEA